jgi:hypothetical protein
MDGTLRYTQSMTGSVGINQELNEQLDSVSCHHEDDHLEKKRR